VKKWTYGNPPGLKANTGKAKAAKANLEKLEKKINLLNERIKKSRVKLKVGRSDTRTMMTSTFIRRSCLLVSSPDYGHSDEDPEAAVHHVVILCYGPPALDAHPPPSAPPSRVAVDGGRVRPVRDVQPQMIAYVCPLMVSL
jgi:hypothetical protein